MRVELRRPVELVGRHAELLGQLDVLLLELAPLDQEALAPGLLRIVEQRQERAPVDEVRRLDARDLGEGRREVAVQDHGLDPLARRHARAAHDRRHADVLLVGEVLAGRQAVLAHDGSRCPSCR